MSDYKSLTCRYCPQCIRPVRPEHYPKNEAQRRNFTNALVYSSCDGIATAGCFIELAPNCWTVNLSNRQRVSIVPGCGQNRFVLETLPSRQAPPNIFSRPSRPTVRVGAAYAPCGEKTLATSPPHATIFTPVRLLVMLQWLNGL